MISKDKIKDLQEMVTRFNAMKLPGQPLGMHMGTSYLVNDLWKTLQEAVKALKECEEKN